MKIFCLSIYNENYHLFKKLNLDPVGLGKENFDKYWLRDNDKINISNKNINLVNIHFTTVYGKIILI